MTGDVKGEIVHDASCLIDLSKGKLLRFVPKLPFRLIVPFPIRHWESHRQGNGRVDLPLANRALRMG